MTTTLHVCPRCDAYVQPDWPSCKICGFDPEHADQHPVDGTVAKRRRPKAQGQSFWANVGALATLLVLIGVVAAGAYLGWYAWNHRDSTEVRQEYVTVAK